jgi:hypothetical protein
MTYMMMINSAVRRSPTRLCLSLGKSLRSLLGSTTSGASRRGPQEIRRRVASMTLNMDPAARIGLAAAVPCRAPESLNPEDGRRDLHAPDRKKFYLGATNRTWHDRISPSLVGRAISDDHGGCHAAIFPMILPRVSGPQGSCQQERSHGPDRTKGAAHAAAPPA